VRRSILFVLMLAVIVSSSCAQQPSEDALKLLDKVAAHYRDAEYLHLEATTLITIHSPRRDGSETGSFSVRLAPGGRFRYRGEDSQGSSEIVSDGTNEWRLMGSFPEYAKAPAGSFFGSRSLYGGDNAALFKARDALGTLTTLDAGIQSAHFAADETLTDGGKPIVCTVVQFGQQDSGQRTTPGEGWQKSVWIDRKSLRILKVESRSHGHTYFGPVAPPHGPINESVTTTTITLSDFSFEPSQDTFTFTPPAGVPEVASLPTGLTGPLPPDSRVKNAVEHVGKPLPEATLRDADGKEFSLSSYRGHPLLIDVWATWCGPCLSEMPTLNQIRKSTVTTDLQMLGVDQDLHSSDAVDLLKRREYDWRDVPYTREFVKALSLGGLPLLVLVNAEGTVVYYHAGADDAKGLAAAIAQLGPAYAGVRTE
jgi:thiol-disulfide isomerase/thioredoxin/outer membrane lipoprotein-sorting protein